MKCMLLVAAIFLLSSCAGTNTIPTDYVGADAGYAVISIGAGPNAQAFSSYRLLFRRVGGAEDTGSFAFVPPNIFSHREPDYNFVGESGAVEVATLPAGKYELVNFSLFSNRGHFQSYLSSRNDFSIPFEVTPGGVVYLGNYQATRFMTGRSLLLRHRVYGPIQFVIDDRLRHDLGIAKARVPSLPTERLRNATPDPAHIGNPLLISVDAARLAHEASAAREAE